MLLMKSCAIGDRSVTPSVLAHLSLRLGQHRISMVTHSGTKGILSSNFDAAINQHHFNTLSLKAGASNS
eukprot:678848-Amphidinium_carterae.1